MTNDEGRVLLDMIDKCLNSHANFKSMVSAPKFTLTVEYVPHEDDF
jgi:hypothetical protein